MMTDAMNNSNHHNTLVREFMEEVKKSLLEIPSHLMRCDARGPQSFFVIYKHFHTLKGMANFLSLNQWTDVLTRAEQVFKQLYLKPHFWEEKWMSPLQKFLTHLENSAENWQRFPDNAHQMLRYACDVLEGIDHELDKKAKEHDTNRSSVLKKNTPPQIIPEVVSSPPTHLLRLLHQLQETPSFEPPPDLIKNALVELRNLKQKLQLLDAQAHELNRRLIDTQRQYAEHLKQLELESKGKSLYLAHVAHEIRTLLNAILGFGTLLSAGGLTAEQRLHLTHLNNSTRMILEFLERIMDFARLEEGRVRLVWDECVLDDVIEPLFQILRTRAVGKNIYLLFDMDDRVPKTILVDAMRLRQILMNLLDNGLKFTRSGWVRLNITVNTPVPGAKEDLMLRFTIDDTGMGIPPDKLQEIFQRFEQVSDDVTRRFGGSGLGLYLVKTFIDKMGGRIAINSTINKGTQFVIELPVKQAALSKKKQAHQKESIAAMAQQIIFIVSPSKELGDHLTNRLTHWGVPNQNVHMFGDTMAVLKRLYDANQVKPSVILIDSLLPDQRAFKLFARIRQDPDYNTTAMFLVSSDLRLEQADIYRSLPDPKGVVLLPLLYDEWMAIFHDNHLESSTTSLDKRAQFVSFSGVRILIVEDSEPNRDLLYYYFQQLDCRIDFACDGAEAVEKIRNNEYDLCFMDIQMPVMDGLTATKKIREEVRSNIPIIALTAASQEEEKQRCFDAGMDDYLAKPFQIDDLKGLIQKHMGI